MPDTIYDAWAAGSGSGSTFEGSGIAIQGAQKYGPTWADLSGELAASVEREKKLLETISARDRDNLRLLEENKQLREDADELRERINRLLKDESSLPEAKRDARREVLRMERKNPAIGDEELGGIE